MAVDIGLVAQVFGDLTSHGQQLAGKLQGAGINLLTGLGVIVVSWQLLTGMLKEAGPGELLANILPVSLKIGVIAWIINDYGWFSSQILAGFDTVSALLSGAPSGASAVQSAIASTTLTAQHIWNSFGTSGEGPGFWDLVKGLAGGAMFWLKLFLMLTTVVLAAIVGVFFILSQTLAGIALALGPIFLPWYVVQGMSWISNGWERYVLSACLMKVVGVIILGFIQSMTKTLMVAAQSYGDQNAVVFDVVGTVVILTISLLMVYLSFQIPSIAQGLVSGSASVSTPTPSSAIQTASQLSNLKKAGGGVPKPPIPGKPTP